MRPSCSCYFQSLLEIILAFCSLSLYFSGLSNTSCQDFSSCLFLLLSKAACLISCSVLKYTEKFTCFMLVLTLCIYISPCILYSVTYLPSCSSAEKSASFLTYLTCWWRCRHCCYLGVTRHVFTDQLSEYNCKYF